MKMITLENLIPGSLIELDASMDATLYFTNQDFDNYWSNARDEYGRKLTSSLENEYIVLPYSNKNPVAIYVEYRDFNNNFKSVPREKIPDFDYNAFVYLKIIYLNKVYWVCLRDCKKYYE